MNKLLILAIILLLVAVTAIILMNQSSIQENYKPKAVKMYDSPIGPTKTEPYILESKIIEAENGNK